LNNIKQVDVAFQEGTNSRLLGDASVSFCTHPPFSPPGLILSPSLWASNIWYLYVWPYILTLKGALCIGIRYPMPWDWVQADKFVFGKFLRHFVKVRTPLLSETVRRVSSWTVIMAFHKALTDNLFSRLTGKIQSRCFLQTCRRFHLSQFPLNGSPRWAARWASWMCSKTAVKALINNFHRSLHRARPQTIHLHPEEETGSESDFMCQWIPNKCDKYPAIVSFKTAMFNMKWESHTHTHTHTREFSLSSPAPQCSAVTWLWLTVSPDSLRSGGWYLTRAWA